MMNSNKNEFEINNNIEVLKKKNKDLEIDKIYNKN